MPIGTVKWFNTTKGFGFIESGSNEPDVFIHISALKSAGILNLQEGQRISYELTTNRGRVSATNVKLV